ncbi:MAG: zf-HC2 domain-containing protein [Eubacteriales bacterium]
MDCEQARERLSAKLDGELTAQEETELEAHLATCQDCQRIYEAYCALDGDLGELVEPPASLRETVMETIRKEKVVKFPKKRWMFGSGTAIAAVAAVLVLVVGGYLPSFVAGQRESFSVTTTTTATMDTGAMVREVEETAVMAMPAAAAVMEETLEFSILTVDCPASEMPELAGCPVEQDENGTYYCWVTGAIIAEICANEAYGVDLPIGYLDPTQDYRIDCSAP